MTTPSNEQSLDGLIERVKRWFGFGLGLPPALVWCVQAHVHPLTGKPLYPDCPNATFHFGSGPLGAFEIFEDGGGNFLLLFPRSMSLPAELFHDLAEAKERALSALKDASE